MLPTNNSKPLSSFSDDEDDLDRDHNTISLTEDNFTFSDTEEEAFMMH